MLNKAAVRSILTLATVIVEIVFSCSTKLQSGTYIRYLMYVIVTMVFSWSTKLLSGTYYAS